MFFVEFNLTGLQQEQIKALYFKINCTATKILLFWQINSFNNSLSDHCQSGPHPGVVLDAAPADVNIKIKIEMDVDWENEQPYWWTTLNDVIIIFVCKICKMLIPLGAISPTFDEQLLCWRFSKLFLWAHESLVYKYNKIKNMLWLPNSNNQIFVLKIQNKGLWKREVPFLQCANG